jgi:SAM-dependent methyltransferase
MSTMSTGKVMGVGMAPVSWYEAGLSLRERKQRGHFSTPPLLVERILDACGYCPENDLSGLRVLDPACGSGNFLAGAARRLVAFAARAGMGEREMAALVECNLWGFDPDPVSCFLAEMNVRAQCQSCDSEVRLHIHQADGLALAWEGYEGIDVFLANPPYLAAKNIDLSGYRSTHRSGQVDSYLLFLDLALAVVRPGGWLGLVLPDPVLARANASRQRARLLETCTITHLWHLSGVFAAHVGAVVLIARKSPAPATHLISWQRANWSRTLHLRAASAVKAVQDEQNGQQEQHMETLNTVPQSLLRRQPGAELRYLLSSERGAFIERLRAHLERASGSKRRLAPLSDFLTIKRGEELGRKSALLVRDQPPSALAGQPHAAAPPAGQAQMFPAPAASADPPPASAGQAQMFPDPAASAGQAQMFPGPPPAGHPQGVALLYTPPSHPPHHRSLAQRANGIVYSRATPCGWPAGGVSADAGGGTADAGGVSADAGGGTADAGGVSADAGGGTADAGDGSADAGGGTADAAGPAGAGGGPADAGGGPGTYFPVLLGGVDVKPYGRPVGKCWLARKAIEKPLQRYLAPKLLVVKSTGQLQAALDTNGHVVLQTLYVLQARTEAGVDNDDLYFFLALLNSRILREYVYVLHTAYKWVQPQIEQHVLARLPVPLTGVAEKRAVIERARRLMEALASMEQEEVCSKAGAVVELKQQWQGLYEEQEQAIDALYAAALEENRS